VICEIDAHPRSHIYFSGRIDVLNDRVEVVYDDAAIVSRPREVRHHRQADPPWVGAAAYMEVFELAKRHLKPGGVVTQCAALRPRRRRENEFASSPVFPDGIAWINDYDAA
jgi:hypothetical protein